MNKGGIYEFDGQVLYGDGSKLMTPTEKNLKELKESVEKYSNEIAPKGKVFQCQACGKKSKR